MSSPAMTNETERLFFALWPDEPVRARLGHLARKLVHKNGRPVAAENLHITLVFLGSVTAARRACVEAVAGGIQGKGFRLTLDRIGHWPKPRILWAGPSDTPAELLALVRDLSEGLRSCDFTPEARPYQAHLTLARKVSRARPGLTMDPVAWDINRFCLVRSLTLPEGVKYEVLASWPLARSVTPDPASGPHTG